MEDRELLEMAVKACGGKVLSRNDFGDLYQIGEKQLFWAPLDDDGDAFRLAGTLGFAVDFGSGIIICGDDIGDEVEFENPSDLANVRRAIVRAAAEIGKAMP